MIGLYGGAFDPPHCGHVALVEGALARFSFSRLLLLVSARPGHKQVTLDIGGRLRLADAAFAGRHRDVVVVADEYPRTIDRLRAQPPPGDAVLLVGADEFAEFLGWKEPEAVLDRVALGVATRPGYPRETLDRVLGRLARRERVTFFEIPAVDVSSTEIRRRIRGGEAIEGLVPDAVARLIRDDGLYRSE